MKTKKQRELELDQDFREQSRIAFDEELKHKLENLKDFSKTNHQIKCNNVGKAYEWLKQNGMEEDYEQ